MRLVHWMCKYRVLVLTSTLLNYVRCITIVCKSAAKNCKFSKPRFLDYSLSVTVSQIPRWRKRLSLALCSTESMNDQVHSDLDWLSISSSLLPIFPPSRTIKCVAELTNDAN
jgi:hypothetical protein